MKYNYLAVVGSRDFPPENFPKVTELLNKFYFTHKPTWLVSGGAAGIDEYVEEWSKTKNLSRMIIRPDWEKFSRSAGMIRNADIIKAADYVLAFVHNNSKGTMNSVQRAEKSGKPTVVFDGDCKLVAKYNIQTDE